MPREKENLINRLNIHLVNYHCKQLNRLFKTLTLQTSSLNQHFMTIPFEMIILWGFVSDSQASLRMEFFIEFSWNMLTCPREEFCTHRDSQTGGSQNLQFQTLIPWFNLTNMKAYGSVHYLQRNQKLVSNFKAIHISCIYKMNCRKVKS